MSEYNGIDRRKHNIPVAHEKRKTELTTDVDQELTSTPNTQKRTSGTGLSVKALSAAIGLIVSVGGGFWAIEDRYVTRKEHEATTQQLQKDFVSSQNEIIKSGKRLFIMQYEDQLDDLEFKEHQGTATDFEKSKIKKIKRRIESIREGDL